MRSWAARCTKRRCPIRVRGCTKCGVGELARDIRALTREVAALRADVEQYRTELRDVFDRFLDEYRHLVEQYPSQPRSGLRRRLRR